MSSLLNTGFCRYFILGLKNKVREVAHAHCKASFAIHLNRRSLLCSTNTFAVENITSPTSFLNLSRKTSSLVLSSMSLALLALKISQISLLWLLFLLEEDQMCDTRANQDMMWHIVKWPSIMHSPSGLECVGPNGSYFSVPLSHCSAFLVMQPEEGKHVSLQWRWQTGASETWTDERTGCSRALVIMLNNTPMLSTCMPLRKDTAVI